MVTVQPVTVLIWSVLVISTIIAANTLNLGVHARASVLDNEINDDVSDDVVDGTGALYDDDWTDDWDDWNDDTDLVGPAREPAAAKKYEPTWTSLDARPLPTWYDEAKIGIFIHWGVYSVPAYGGAWFWYRWLNTKQANVVKYMEENYSPSFTYQDFGPMFTARFYDPSEWVKLFEKAGARYVVLTSKHHEGYTNWPSKYSFGWNSMAVGPKRDLVGELAAATKKSSLKFGLYHSLFEFMNPMYLQDVANGFNTTEFADFKTMPELYELVRNYEPQLIWSDGAKGDESYWKSREFLAWLYNESPVKDTVVVNDRWGTTTSCQHGGFWNCHDNYNPGHLQSHKWENAFTLDKKAWAYRIDAVPSDYHTLNELIHEITVTISCGGNVLLNVGPTAEGTIIPIMQERLLQLGGWLGVVGDAIYGTSPWTRAQNDTTTKSVWYTAKPAEHKLYAIVLEDAWTALQRGTILLDSVKLNDVEMMVQIGLLGYPDTALYWEVTASGGLLVHLPRLDQFQHPIKTNYGWALVISLKPGADYF